jgi:hypothetical protein
MKRWPTCGHVPSIVLLIVLTFNLCIAVASAGNGTITVGGSAPEVASIAIDTYPTTEVNATHIPVDTQYMIVLNAADSNLLTNEAKIEVQLYTDHYNDTGDIRHHYSFVWTCGGGFANVGPSGQYFDSGDSHAPTLTNTWGLFNFTFKLDKLAIYTNAGSLHWTVEAHIYSKSGSAGWRSNTFDVDLYQSLTIDSSVTWTGLSAGTSWNSASSPNPGSWTYTSNAIAKISIYATTPTNGFGDTIPVGDIHVAQSSDHLTNPKDFTVSPGVDWLTNLPNNANQNEAVYWFVDVPAGQPTGTYTFTYYAAIDFYQYAT